MRTSYSRTYCKADRPVFVQVDLDSTMIYPGSSVEPPDFRVEVSLYVNGVRLRGGERYHGIVQHCIDHGRRE